MWRAAQPIDSWWILIAPQGRIEAFEPLTECHWGNQAGEPNTAEPIDPLRPARGRTPALKRSIAAHLASLGAGEWLTLPGCRPSIKAGRDNPRLCGHSIVGLRDDGPRVMPHLQS